MSVLEKAKILADAIADSPELLNMRESQDTMMKNSEAVALVEEFNMKQKRFMELSSQGFQLTQQQRDEISDIEKKMMANNLVLDYFKAQKEFEKMLNQINHFITKAITGQSCDDGCSSGCCSSCGGGCS